MSTKKALITGITGQDGSYLAELLLAKGYEVHGLIRRSSSFNTGRIDHLYQDPHEADAAAVPALRRPDSTQSSLMSHLHAVKPDEVYNLGAQSHVKVSFEMPEYTAESAGIGALRLLEAIRTADWPIRFYQAGSSEMYGTVLETPADRDDAVPPAQPVRRRQGLRVPHHRQLPRGLRHVRLQRHPLQPRVTAPRRDLRHAQDHPRRGRHRGRARRTSSTSATSTPSATGATPATTSRPCG